MKRTLALLSLPLLLLLAGCGGSGSSTQNATGDTCASRPDGLTACLQTRIIEVSISRPYVSALDLLVGGEVILPAIANGPGFYESVDIEWAPSFEGGPPGEWLIFTWVLRQSKNTAVVRGYNPTTKAQWSAMFSVSANRYISGGRVYYDHLEHGDTTHWSIKLDGTDHHKEF